MINSITLSTGKVYKIPIFDAFTGDPESKTRANGVLIDVPPQSHRIIPQGLTDSELMEIIGILSGVTVTSLGNIPGAVGAHEVGPMYWYYSAADEKYMLCTPFTVDMLGNVIWNLTYFGDNSNTNYFYNSSNTYNTHATDYSSYVEWAKEHIVEPAACYAANCRSGYLYSFDILGCIWFQTISFGNSYSEETIYTNMQAYALANPDKPFDYTEPDGDFTDPYGNIISSGGGGGDGDLNDPDSIEKATIPALPAVSAVDAGMITMYYATSSQLQTLAAFLWANIYDLDTNFVKLFASPMDCIIGLSIVPVMPSISGGANVKFGNINTTVSMSKLSTQYVEKDLGSVKVSKFVGCFMDYTQTKISIYLPYIGFRDLDPADVMGENLHVVYHIDCLTGGCTAFIECGSKGLLYSFNGSCIANVPVTAINYSGAIQNAVSMVSNAGSLGVNAATGNFAGIAGNLTTAANTIFNSKPTIERSGNMGGAPGIMAYQKPMLVIQRPRLAVPNNLNHFKGNTLYVTRKLAQCQGFNQIDMINLDGVPCTRAERNELESILKEGVYF